jgi:DNA adenine methylase
MPEHSSPLRYPGGKTALARLLGQIVALNKLGDCVYAEPYAGGAGAALSLLFAERVSKILINDADRCVYAFWWSLLKRPDAFLRLLDRTPVTISEWRRQREIYRSSPRSRLELGFATFFLNRCNRSGIIMNGGPIGGIKQKGKWKLNARYNKAELRRRIEKIVMYRERIEVFNLDALDFLRKIVMPLSTRLRVFVYLDPPYYLKGKLLYLNAYDHEDHVKLATFIRGRRDLKWLISYDNAPQIKRIYQGMRRRPFDLSHSAFEHRQGQELLIHSDRLIIPGDISSLVTR